MRMYIRASLLVFILVIIHSLLDTNFSSAEDHYVKSKPPRPLYRIPFAMTAIYSLEKKMSKVFEKLNEARSIVADNSKKVRSSFEELNAIIDFAERSLEKYRLDCPYKYGVKDIARGNCLIHRNIKSYARSWKDARQYCLKLGGDLAQPLWKDTTYAADLLAFFPELGDLEADIYVGIRSVPVSSLRSESSLRMKGELNQSRNRNNKLKIATSMKPKELPRLSSFRSDYEYQYFNGLVLPNHIINYKRDGVNICAAGRPDKGIVAALALPINEELIEFTNRDGNDKRGFLCEFKLKPNLPFKFQSTIDEIGEVFTNPDDLIDVEAPMENYNAEHMQPDKNEQQMLEEKEVILPKIYSDFVDDLPPLTFGIPGCKSAEKFTSIFGVGNVLTFRPNPNNTFMEQEMECAQHCATQLVPCLPFSELTPLLVSAFGPYNDTFVGVEMTDGQYRDTQSNLFPFPVVPYFEGDCVSINSTASNYRYDTCGYKNVKVFCVKFEN